MQRIKNYREISLKINRWWSLGEPGMGRDRVSSAQHEHQGDEGNVPRDTGDDDLTDYVGG